MRVTCRSPRSKPLQIFANWRLQQPGVERKKDHPVTSSAPLRETSVPGPSSKQNRRQAAAGPTNLPSVRHHWAPVSTEQRTAHYQPLLAVAVHLGSPHDRNSLQSHPAAAQPSPRCTRHRGAHTSLRPCVGSVTASRDLPLSDPCLYSPHRHRPHNTTRTVCWRHHSVRLRRHTRNSTMAPLSKATAVAATSVVTGTAQRLPQHSTQGCA
jgi:hypothetical protein